ncbi:MAG: DinB family protein [Candidatus Sumerlaeaceae bacterium]
MTSTETLIDQTLGLRQLIVKLLKSIPLEQADNIPPTWHNNARWHAGHLVVTPAMLTHGILKEPLGVPEEFRTWFAKGSSPAGWGNDSVPDYHDLCDDLLPASGRLFEAMRSRMDDAFMEPYTTSTGVVLHTPAQALNFSLAHDGIHLGMLMALKRGLDAMHR